MPKKVFDAFFHAAVRDIKNHYQMGDKYLSIRQMAEKYQVSIQTAQRGVKKLEEYGYITVKRKAGITIDSLRPRKKLEGYRIAVISARTDKRFNDALFKGIQETANEKGVSARFEPIPDIDTNSLGFGDYLLSLDADGIIALYFNNSALPFYHVMREGRDIVADIILDELPSLPVVQTDNFRHAQEAGRIFVEQGYRRFLAVGYYPRKRNRRFEGMWEAVKDNCDDVRYIHLADIGSMTAIDTFFHDFNSRCAVYSVDYSTNYIVGAKFIQYKIPVKNDNFLVYDCEGETFNYHGLNPIRSVAPSFYFMGSELCKVLIAKQETGAYPEPRQRKI
ncbi:MAG: HTH domain-containing protein [Treponema sp.]|jgi:DNA-binding transcriptional regulator YhcF (GntR family)|nr:HTH domain-containing protein [Treponema sp.]